MQIIIIGTGALGMLFGTYAHLCQFKVHYITRRMEQARQIREKGLCVKLYSGQTVHYYPQVTAVKEMTGRVDADLGIVTVKQPALGQVLPWIVNHVSQQCDLIFLMNGLGHQELVENFLQRDKIMYGVTQCGATKLSDIETVERGRGVTKIGSFSGSNPANASVQHWMKQMGDYLDVSLTSEIAAEMWSKAIINACINPLTALFQLPNGKLIENRHLNRMMRQVYDELLPLTAKVWASDHPLNLNKEELWKKIENVCRLTAENYSSMLQDIRNNRKTEIESLNGYFVRQASRYGLNLSANQLLYHAILALEEKMTR
jgi:2-dehydropantoate 2-reductase